MRDRNESIELCSEKELTLLSPALLSEATDTSSQLSTTIIFLEIFMEDLTQMEIIPNMEDLLENNRLQEADKLKSNMLIMKLAIS